MAQAVLYLCEAAGARIFAYGQGIGQVGTNYQASLQSWDDLPSGETGVNLFRSVNAVMKTVGAWTIGITPTVDGEDQPEQIFSGAGSGQQQCEAFIGQRGTRISATWRTIARAGDIELQQLSQTCVQIRTFP